MTNASLFYRQSAAFGELEREKQLAVAAAIANTRNALSSPEQCAAAPAASRSPMQAAPSPSRRLGGSRRTAVSSESVTAAAAESGDSETVLEDGTLWCGRAAAAAGPTGPCLTTTFDHSV